MQGASGAPAATTAATSTSESTCDLRGLVRPDPRAAIAPPRRSFDISVPLGRPVSAATGRTVTGTLRVDAGYPARAGRDLDPLARPDRAVQHDPAHRPAATRRRSPTVPGLGGLLGSGELGSGPRRSLAGVPGQVALFASAPLTGRDADRRLVHR